MSDKVKDFVKRYASSMDNVSRPGRTAGVAMGGGAIGGGDDYKQKIGRNKIPWNLRDFQGSPSMAADAGFSSIAMQRIASPDAVTRSRKPMFPEQGEKDTERDNNYSLAGVEEEMKEIKIFDETARVKNTKYSLTELESLMSEDVASFSDMKSWVEDKAPDWVSDSAEYVGDAIEKIVPDPIEDAALAAYDHVVDFLETVKEKYGDPAFELMTDKLEDITGTDAEDVMEKAASVAKEIGRDFVMLAAAGLPVVGTPIAASFILYNLGEMQIGMERARKGVDNLIVNGSESDVNELERVSTQLYNDYIDFLQAIPYLIPGLGAIKGVGKIAGKVASAFGKGNLKKAGSFIGLGGSGAFASALKSEILLSPIFEFATSLSDVENLDDIGIDSTYFIDNIYEVPAALSILAALRTDAETQLEEWRSSGMQDAFKFVPSEDDSGDAVAAAERLSMEDENFDDMIDNFSDELEDAAEMGSVENIANDIFENNTKDSTMKKNLSGEDLVRAFIREAIYHAVSSDAPANPAGYAYRQPLEPDSDDESYKSDSDFLVNYKTDMGGVSYQSTPEQLKEEALRRIIRRKLQEQKKTS